MSADSTTDFVEFDPRGDSTILRFPLSIELADRLISEYVKSSAPGAKLLDEIHILVSPSAIKKAYEAIPFPEGVRPNEP